MEYRFTEKDNDFINKNCTKVDKRSKNDLELQKYLRRCGIRAKIAFREIFKEIISKSGEECKKLGCHFILKDGTKVVVVGYDEAENKHKVWITIDDNFSSNYTVAMRVSKEAGCYFGKIETNKAYANLLRDKNLFYVDSSLLTNEGF